MGVAAAEQAKRKFSEKFKDPCRFRQSPFVVLVKAGHKPQRSTNNEGDPPMQYLISVHHSAGDAVPTEEQKQQMFIDVDAFNKEVQANGAWVFANGLQGPETAKTIDASSGKTNIENSTISKCETQIGGFWVIDVAEPVVAEAYAAKASKAVGGAVELRPFQALPEGV